MTEKKKIGRPTAYKAEYAKEAEGLCARGATDVELADYFGVVPSTIYQWKIVNSAFSKATKDGKAEADARVERSLYQRAMGYEHEEVDIRVVGQEIVQTMIRKRYPPDATSMIFWLKNRRPAEWRDKQDIEHTGKNGGPIEIKNLTDAQRASRLAYLLAQAAAKAAEEDAG